MPEPVLLPSGLVLELEAPPVRRLLWCDGLGIRQMAEACMERATVRVCDLDDEDALFVASWGFRHLDEDEAASLGEICLLYLVTPGSYLRVTNRVLAFDADREITAAFKRVVEGEDADKDEPSIAPDDPVYGFPREDQ